MKNPDKIHRAFKTRADEAARICGELEQRRADALKRQVETLRGIETGYEDGLQDPAAARAAAGYARASFAAADKLRHEAERIAQAEVLARRQLKDCFADQKRFEAYEAQCQRKQKALDRRREETRALEEILQLQGRTLGEAK
jgi:hypothetical protein